MRTKLWINMLLAVFMLGLVALRPLSPMARALLGRPAAGRLRLSAQDLTATVPAPAQSAPTAEPTPAAQDTTQSTAAVVIIWAVIVIVVAVTVFLIWWTRPGRKSN